MQHRSIEFQVVDVAKHRRVLKPQRKYEDAIVQASSLSIMHGKPMTIEVVAFSASGARWYGENFTGDHSAEEKVSRAKAPAEGVIVDRLRVNLSQHGARS